MAGVMVHTHAAIWYTLASPKLSNPAKTAIQSAYQNGEPVQISVITLVELVYLIDKRRFTQSLLDDFRKLIQNSQFVEVPLNSSILDQMQQVPYAQVPDMPDRIIAAAALMLGVPLVTRDARIQALAMPTIW